MPVMRPEGERVPERPSAARNVLPRLFPVGEEPAVDGALEGDDDNDATVDAIDWIARVAIAVVEAVA